MSKINSDQLVELGKAARSWLLLNDSREIYTEDENEDIQNNIHHFNCGWNACRTELMEAFFSVLTDLSDDDDDECGDNDCPVCTCGD